MRAAGTVAVPISMPDLPGALERAHIGRTSPQLPVPKRVTHKRQKGQTCSPERDGRMCLQVVKP